MENTTLEQPVIKTMSFREVHEELEKESTFLNKNHDINTFKEKGDFLRRLGFENSIATKLYSAVAASADIVDSYRKRYNEMYKFILKPQLERVCEKYNLFVRDLHWFLADIPEKNIKDMMNFKFDMSDLPDDVIVGIVRYAKFFYMCKIGILPDNMSRLSNQELDKHVTLVGTMPNSRIVRYGLLYVEIPSVKISLGEFFQTLEEREGVNIDDERLLRHLSQARRSVSSNSFLARNLFQIAAIPSMFAPGAFSESSARIIDVEMEPPAKHQVDLDPIVMMRTKHGYIVITAWGDEANDELIANQKFN